MSKKKWDFLDIPDMSGKIIIVTGANCGLGFEATRYLALKNAKVIMAVRSLDKGNDSKKTILEEYPKAKLDVMLLDLADLKSVNDFAINFKKKYKKLDVLMNNAGVMMCPYSKTKDGFEMQFGINHLGHFALTGLLLDVLKKTKNSRIVNVSSIAHRFGKMDFSNLMFEKGNYNSIKSYGRSKLANLLFTYELQRKLEKNKLDIIAVAAHPGSSSTNLTRHIETGFFIKHIKPLVMSLYSQTARIGTLPQVRAAVDKNVKGGDYFGPKGFMETKGYPIKVKSNKRSHSLEDAKKLWEISEKLTNVKYTF